MRRTMIGAVTLALAMVGASAAAAVTGEDTDRSDDRSVDLSIDGDDTSDSSASNDSSNDVSSNRVQVDGDDGLVDVDDTDDAGEGDEHAEEKAQCRNGGHEDSGSANQGRCIASIVANENAAVHGDGGRGNSDGGNDLDDADDDHDGVGGPPAHVTECADTKGPKGQCISGKAKEKAGANAKDSADSKDEADAAN